MRRKHYILILLFLWWPINNLHRLWNSAPAQWVHWYLFNDAAEDIQWYVHDLAQTLSYALIFWAVWLKMTITTRRSDADYEIMVTAIAIIQAIDIFHYIGWHRRSEVVLAIEGLILCAAALKIFIKYRKSIHHKHG
ncbi:hypothetical protein [Chitinophaga pinensis]|uniref:Uncharacterized protein n=1 Tax=Chitinophaga pinensis (strain ATCC 43595 / DSM 2588 / LMG 13176 / NBRC 15968 / NCIMB 11800 / UQM 2034) TaxID=485918 RepID=A0A979GVW3_CHIPD|nr:hypothetical protein [Chitinophaga pinensis]ACU61371.1 hypothetical protein Cpin_3909 [Chitinophaga pinensis DSM 2588]